MTLGGAERVLVDTVNKLVEKYDITIFTLYSKGELEDQVDRKVKLISMFNKKYTELSKKEKVLIPIKVLFNKKSIFKNYIDNEKYDVQIAFLEGPVTRIFSVDSSNNVKKIAWIHNDISKVFGKGIKSKIKRIIDRNAYEKYDTLVFVSMDNIDKFNKLYDDILLPKEKVIHNYINQERILKLAEDTKEYKDFFNKKDLNIVQVSRLVEQKAIDRLINVHSKLIKQGIKHHIYIIGDGPEKEKLEEQIKKLKVNGTFTLLGAIENPYPYIKRSDVFCLFSKYEGYPTVITEAKILNKFIACTNSSAREALQDYSDNSIIVENSEKGIEEAIKEIVKNKSKILNKKSEYVYTNQKIIDKIEKVFEEEGKK